MTSVIFNDPSGSDFLYKFSGVQLNAPSGETLALGANANTADNSNAIVTVGESYIRIPQGISNERPDISNSYIGMMRYLTTDNLLEYFNGQTNTWVPISLPSPSISSISPNYISFDASGQETNTNTYTLTGSDFNNALGGISVEVIGNNGVGTILTPDSNSASSETSATFTFDPSGTEQLIGISNELPFAVKLTNTNSGFSSILNNAIIATNAGPEFTQPSVFTPSSFETFPVQDPCANFIVGGIDLSSPVHYPLTFTFVSGTAGGFNEGGANISNITDFSAIVQVPSGNRLSALASSYNFRMRVTDASSATSDANYTLSLANPTITSIDPSYIYDTSVVDINITGTYFIRDSDISFNKGSNTLTQTDVSYNSSTSLTVKDVSAGSGGQYDISLANGSVIVNVPSVVLNILSINQIQFSTTNLFSTTYLEAGGINDSLSTTGSPVRGGWTVLRFNGDGSITFTNLLTSNQIRYLVIGGGGGGGGTDGGADGTGGAGGGGAGGYKDETTTSFTNNTSYTITVGNGGAGGSAVTNGATGSFGQPGDDSSISTIVSVDGGGSGGSSYADGNNTNGGNGGSGGGAGGSDNQGRNEGIATSGQGFNGGSTDANGGGAGGGGAGAVGSTNTGQSAGNGGSGSSSNITGSSVTRAGGGGGGTGATGTGGSGGSGGGGQGGSRGVQNSTAGVANTGSGGGGGCDYQTTQSEGAGSSGGSGIIILRIPSYIYTLP